MKKVTLALAAASSSVATLWGSDTRATCPDDYRDCGTNCCYHDEQGNYDMYSGFDSWTVTIHPEKEGEDIIVDNLFPAYYEQSVQTFILSEGVTKVDELSFYNGYGDLYTLYVPDSLKEVGYEAFYEAKEIIVSENVDTTNWDEDAFGDYGTITIRCIGDIEKCSEKFENFNHKDFTYTGVTQDQCTGNYEWVSESCVRKSNNNPGSNTGASCNANQLEKEGKCVAITEGCGANFRQIENWCNRVRYTPAEAAAVANDDNTNVVTITFKK